MHSDSGTYACEVLHSVWNTPVLAHSTTELQLKCEELVSLLARLVGTCPHYVGTSMTFHVHSYTNQPRQ